MGDRFNEFGQPVGFPLPGWVPRPAPPRRPIDGRWCRVEPLDPGRHARALYEANGTDPRMWTYMSCGPFASFEDYSAWMTAACLGDDPLFHAVVDLATGSATGVASFLRIVPAMGVIEVGNIAWSPSLKRRPAATEAMFLMMRRVFDELGYRRYEWKCDALNEPSRRAAERLGFRFEGIFRQALVYKGRNRDTAWYSVVDSEWPALRQAFEAWLEPANFAADGRQHRRLGDLVAAARVSNDH